MNRAAICFLALPSLVASAHAAPRASPPTPRHVSIRRPGPKAVFVQLELRTDKGRHALLGCQTGRIEARCGRRRTRIPLSSRQVERLTRLWRRVVERPKCRTRPLPASWGLILTRRPDGTVVHQGPMVPSRTHPHLKRTCFELAVLGWWLLDRYDRRPVGPAKPPLSIE